MDRFTVPADPSFVCLPCHCLALNSPVDEELPDKEGIQDDEDKKQRQYETVVSFSGFLCVTVRVAVTVA